MNQQLTIEELIQNADAALQKVHQESYSSKIQRLNKVEATCNCCGHKTVSYRMRFRSQLLPALFALSKSQRALTLAELSDQFTGALARYISDYFAEIRHWNLAKKENGKWSITEEGRRFLSGNAKIPQGIWQRDKGELPDSCVDGPLVAITDLDGWHPGMDKSEHAEQSMPIACV